MSRALAAIAARITGRRVEVKCTACGHRTGITGTVTRVTGAGITAVFPGLTHEELTLLQD